VEPEGRNTAPAALAAALVADPDDTLVILPSDHLIEESGSFGSLVERAASLAGDGYIVTFGIVPDRPETGYGYIAMGEGLGDGARVREFIEKPSDDQAARLLGEGSHLWNSGMFVVSVGTLLAEAEKHCPDLLGGVRSALGDPDDGVLELGASFGDVEKISIDHAIMERTSKAAVMPLDAGWDDVGSFQALWAVSDKDEDGNAVSGDVSLLDVHDSLVHATSRKVAVVGLDGIVVVETPEAVLVVPRERAQDVRDIAEAAGSD
jgi:mannose-1-phosphate guanylyltransferase/mannose-6-phosphate isomerase